MTMSEKQKSVGIFVGRLCPIHVGHETIIEQMIDDCGLENCMIILGSVGQGVTFRVLFPYTLRKKWIRAIFGNTIKINGVPDFPNDDFSWLELIEDQIDSAFGDCGPVVFYGGSVSDVEIFHEHGYQIRIVDRTQMPVSATVIRDMALRGMDISPFVNPVIHDDFKHKFARAMEESEKWTTPF